jgi:hypothetical protein
LAKTNSEALNLAVVTDEFDADMFAKNVDTEQHVDEDDEAIISESDEGPSLVAPHVPAAQRGQAQSRQTEVA